MDGIRRAPLTGDQESVWDYPRPPRLEQSARHVEVRAGGRLIADSVRAFRVLETSHPPVYYIPPQDIVAGVLREAPGQTFCEFKGAASYYDLEVGQLTTRHAAWYYPQPSRGFESLAGCVAFYPGLMERCAVDGETVTAQAGDFYGGWITSNVIGPFKGAPGTAGW